MVRYILQNNPYTSWNADQLRSDNIVPSKVGELCCSPEVFEWLISGITVAPDEELFRQYPLDSEVGLVEVIFKRWPAVSRFPIFMRHAIQAADLAFLDLLLTFGAPWLPSNELGSAVSYVLRKAADLPHHLPRFPPRYHYSRQTRDDVSYVLASFVPVRVARKLFRDLFIDRRAPLAIDDSSIELVLQLCDTFALEWMIEKGAKFRENFYVQLLNRRDWTGIDEIPEFIRIIAKTQVKLDPAGFIPLLLSQAKEIVGALKEVNWPARRPLLRGLSELSPPLL